MVPLDACRHVPLNRAFYQRLAANPCSRAARFVHDALTADITFVMSDQFYFWDPLAAAILADPTLVQSSDPALPARMQLSVVQTLDEGKDCSGQILPAQTGPFIDVAMWADAERFYGELLRVLNLPDVE